MLKTLVSWMAQIRRRKVVAVAAIASVLALVVSIAVPAVSLQGGSAQASPSTEVEETTSAGASEQGKPQASFEMSEEAAPQAVRAANDEVYENLNIRDFYKNYVANKQMPSIEVPKSLKGKELPAGTTFVLSTNRDAQILNGKGVLYLAGNTPDRVGSVTYEKLSLGSGAFSYRFQVTLKNRIMVPSLGRIGFWELVHTGKFGGTATLTIPGTPPEPTPKPSTTTKPTDPEPTDPGQTDPSQPDPGQPDPEPACPVRVADKKKPAREITPEEYAEGSPVYVVTSHPKTTARRTSILSRQTDQATNFREIGRSNWVYNALTYNPNDNWLYAISQKRGKSGDNCFPAGYLLQIDPRYGRVYNLGQIRNKSGTGSPFTFNGSNTQNDRELLNTGVWTDNGYFVANTSTSGTRKLYKVNIDNVTAEPVFRNLFGLDTISWSEDWAVHPDAPQYMWGVQSRARHTDYNRPVRLVLERIDSRTGTVREWDITNLRDEYGRIVPWASQESGSWGKAWTYANKNFGFGNGSDSAGSYGFELKITNPDAINPTFQVVRILDNLPSSFNTDAASNILPPKFYSNLKIEKTRSETKYACAATYTDQMGKTATYSKECNASDNGAELRTFWTITIKNTSKYGSSGGVFTEQMPTQTHYGFATAAGTPTARTEPFGPGSTIVNGKRPGVFAPETPENQRGIYAGWESPNGNSIKGFVGALAPGQKVEFVISSPVKTDENDNVVTVCEPNKVKLVTNDPQAEGGEDDDVAIESCFTKRNVDEKPVPVHGQENAFTATYDVVISYPDGIPAEYKAQEVIYGKVTDTPKFLKAATIENVTVAFKDEFSTSFSQPTVMQGSAPYVLNSEAKVIRPKGARKNGSLSTGEHVYRVTITFKLNPTGLKPDAKPGWYTGGESGDYLCFDQSEVYEPHFGLMNEAEMGGATYTTCIPIEPPAKAMDILLEKVSYDPEHPNNLQTGALLAGAEFGVYKATADGNLALSADGSVNTALSPAVAQSATGTDGRVRLEELAAPGTYFLIETKSPNGYSLLAAPVKFATSWGADGSAVIEIQQGAGLAAVGNKCDSDSQGCTKELGIIQIADVTTGELPKTGGLGIPVWAMLGAALVLGGSLAMRRRAS